MKLNKLLFLFLLILKGQLIFAQEDNFEKIAVATVNPLNIKIDIGEDFNIIELENFGEIKLLHRDLDKMEIKKEGNTLKAGFYLTNKEIIVENLKQKGQHLSFDFKFKNLKAADITFSGRIKFLKGNSPSIESFSAQKEVLVKYILPVVHDYLTAQSMDIKSSCLSNAIEACVGNILELDVNMLFSGCYFKCV